MNAFPLRAGRVRPVLLLIAATIAGACADDRSITAPRPNASQPTRGATTDVAELADIPTVTINPARTGYIRDQEGFVELSATIACSKDGLAIRVAAYLT